MSQNSMNQNLTGRFNIDLHTHCLPGIDDGAENPEISVEMLSLLKRQGIQHVVLTSHFYPHKESLSSFLIRRNQAWEQLYPYLDRHTIPSLSFGAEIYLVRELSCLDLRALRLGKSDYLLIEMPRLPYKAWMAEEVRNISYANQSIPIIAHIERYQSWYKKEDYDELLAFEDQILQFNTSSILNKSHQKFIHQLSKKGYPLVISSDCHNLEDRTPDFDVVSTVLNKNKRGREIQSSLRNSDLLMQIQGVN